MPESGAIDQAVLAVLQNDATLNALVPDGVYMDEAPPNKRRYVVVSLASTADVSVFGQRGIEDVLYRVKAVMLSSANGNIKGAAQRIDELLESQPLTANGYGWMTSHREERVRYVEVDPIDATLRWHHRGGLYRVQMSVA